MNEQPTRRDARGNPHRCTSEIRPVPRDGVIPPLVMGARVACFLVLLAAFGVAAPVLLHAQDAPPLPLPTEWTTAYAWFLVANPEYAPGTQVEEAALSNAHIQYQLRLQEDGRAVAAGGFGPGEDASLVGLTLLRARSLGEARALAQADPAVQAGRLGARVREWWVPAGRLPGDGAGAEGQLAGVRAEVLAFVESHRLALEARDAQALSGMYAGADRFQWVEDGAVRYRSVDQVLEGLRSFPPEMPVVTEYVGTTVTPVAPDIAQVSTGFATRAGSGPEGFAFQGHMTMVVERGPDGWRIVAGHTSTSREN